MRRKARWAVVAVASALNLATLAVADHLSWVAYIPALLVTAFIVSWQTTLLMMEKIHGQHRRTEADTPDPETSGTAIDPNGSFALHYARAGRYASAGSGPVEAAQVEPLYGLERVESDMPILAHRSARLCLDGTSRHFRSVVQGGGGGGFGVDAEASCGIAWKYVAAGLSHYYDRPSSRPHKAPGPRCECGFYALPTDLAPTYEDPAFVTLMVELSGTVIEHERGYRAEHQRVVECQIQPCLYCGAEADLLVVRAFLMEQATCVAHKPVDEPGVVYLDIADLAEVLPVPVTRAGRRLRHAGGEG